MSGPEKRFQDQCIKILRRRGIYYINEFGDGFSGKGKPDLICCVGGRFVAFELKVGKNDMQADQVVHKHRIEKSGGLHFCPRPVEEFEADLDSVNFLTKEA